jgi:hypothetical protein
MEGLSLLPNRHRQFDAGVKQLALLNAHSQEIGGIANFPTRRLNCFAFRGIHQSILIANYFFLAALTAASYCFKRFLQR